MKPARNLLIALLILLGIGALFGGAVLIISPSGISIGMPVSVMKIAIFPNFLIPGLALFTILGVAPILVSVALVTKPQIGWCQKINACYDMHWAWTFTIYIALALIIWLQVEMNCLQAVIWAHSLYMGCAIAIIALALLPNIRTYYKQENLKK